MINSQYESAIDFYKNSKLGMNAVLGNGISDLQPEDNRCLLH